MQFSISFNQSHKSNMSHNNREHLSGNPDIDEERSDTNIYFIQEDIREVYKELFDEAVESYNAKQSRSDRKIEDYYTKVHNDSKTHEQRELIVAIGEGKDPDEFRDDKREALIDYALEFEERNPNLKVYNMVLHDDEANPHLHINYVPHFESKRGLTKRVGMDKALQQQGIEGKGKELIGNWRAVETARIEALAKENIPDFERANVGSHKYMKVPQYKEFANALEQQKQEYEKIFESQKADLEAVEEVLKQEKAKVVELQQKNDQLVDSIKDLEFERKEKNSLVQKATFKSERLEYQVEKVTEKLETLTKELNDIEVPHNKINSIEGKRIFGTNRVAILTEDFEHIKNLAKQSLIKNENNIEIQKENRELKILAKDQQLQIENEKKETQKQKALADKYFSEKATLSRSNKKLTKEVEKYKGEANKYKRLYEYAKDWLKQFKVFDQLKEYFVKEEKQIDREQKEKVNELELGD